MISINLRQLSISFVFKLLLNCSFFKKEKFRHTDAMITVCTYDVILFFIKSPPSIVFLRYILMSRRFKFEVMNNGF